jgi:UDP-2,3-diacylglucosamine pyrophosphatase LpxH
MVHKEDKLPDYNSIEQLKQIYNKLAAPVRTHYKTMVRVYLRHGNYDVSVVHDDENHVGLKKKNYRNAVSVKPIMIKDGDGQKPLKFQYTTAGSLYAPQSSLSYSGMSYPWALCFKIDCDLARKKTGDIEDAIIHYVSDFSIPDIKRKKLDALKSKAGRPRKSNYRDLKDRYGNDPEVNKWLRENRKALNRGNFSYDDYRNQVEQNSVSISAIDSRI